MILLKKVSLINFISHSNTEIEFNNNDKILIDGVSGSGKSSIIEAIIWCLYGEGRSQNRNLVKKGRTEATVTLYLNDDGVFYRIKRNVNLKGSQGVEIYSSDDGTTYNKYVSSGVKESQSWIEKELIGASYELFINSVVYLQDKSNHFINKSSIEKKDLLMEIIGLNHLDEYLIKAKEKQLELSNKAISVNSTIVEKNNSLSKIDLSIYDKEILTKRRESLEKEKDRLLGIKLDLDAWFNKIESKRFKLNNDNNYIELLRDGLDRNFVKILGLEDKIKGLKERTYYNTIDLAISTSNLEKAKKDLEKIKNQEINNFELAAKRMSIMADKPNFIDYDYEIKRIRDQVDPLIQKTSSCKRFNEPCPYCGDDCPLTSGIKQQIEFFNNEISRLEKMKESQSDAMECWVQRMSTVPIENNIDRSKKEELEKSILIEEEAVKMFTLEKEDIARIKDYEMELRIEKDLGSKSIKMMVDHDYEILEISNELDWDNMEKNLEKQEVNNKLLKSIESSISEVLYSLLTRESMSEQSDTLQKEISALKNDLNGLQRDLDAINTLIKALGPNGIRAMVIDNAVPRLERKINEILSQLSNFRVIIETQRSRVAGDGNIEGLFINITNDKGETLDFDNYSGGERLKIVVAISEALASLQKVGFRIFDELFVGLDEDSIIGFSDIMERLQSKFNQVVCISHLRSIKDTFDKVIEVRKINGSSSISLDFPEE